MLLSLLYPPPASQVTLDWSQSIIVRCQRGLEDNFGIERNSFAGVASTFACFVGGIAPVLLTDPEPETIAAVNYRPSSSIENSTQPLALVMGLSRGLPTTTASGIGNASVPGGGVSATQIGLMFAAIVIVLDQHYGTDFNSALDHRINSLKLYASHEWERLVDKISPRVADAAPIQILNITKEQQDILDNLEQGKPLTLEQDRMCQDAIDNKEPWLFPIAMARIEIALSAYPLLEAILDDLENNVPKNEIKIMIAQYMEQLIADAYPYLTREAVLRAFFAEFNIFLSICSSDEASTVQNLFLEEGSIRGLIGDGGSGE